MSRRRSRRRNLFEFSKRTIIIAASSVAALALIVTLFVLVRTETATVQTGQISFSYTGTGIIVRTEKLYRSENYGKTVFIAEEGQRVKAGDEIADVYSWDYNEKRVESLKALQDNIMDYQENHILKDVLSKGLQSQNQLIEQKTEEIKQVVAGEKKGDLLRLERELRNLLQQRQKFLRETAQEDDMLKDYYEQEKALEDMIEDWKKTILAEKDGRVSFYFDGTETLLTPENMTKLTVSNIIDIVNGKKFYKFDATTASRPLYRLVDENEWYAILVSDTPILEFESPTAFKIDMKDSDKLTGKIISSKEDSDKYMYYLKFSQPISGQLLTRQADMRVFAEYVGLKVPAQAVVEKDGQKGINTDIDGSRVFEPVNVLTQQNGEAIIQAVNQKSKLAVGNIIYY